MVLFVTFLTQSYVMNKILTVILVVLTHTAFAEISSPIIGKLDNGLNYTILPLHEDKGRIEIRLRVRAGSVDETDTQAGVAHMVEHLVFRTSDKHPDGVMTHLHDLGFVRAKHYNAVTTTDSTTYLMTPPIQVGLDGSLSALSQMMFFAHLTQADLDKERQIITEEWRGGQGVSAHMDEQRKAVVRADSRYVRSPVIGTFDSIRTMPAQELQAFYHTWYTPNNMNLLIMGDVNPRTTKNLIDTHFGQIPSKALPDRSGDYYDVKLSDRLVIKELHDDRSGVSQVAYIVRFDESASRGDSLTARKNRLIDRFALTFITKRLHNELSHLPDGIKSVVARKSDIGKNTVALGIFSSVNKDKHKEGLQEIFYQIQRLKNHPITQSELDEYKKDLQKQLDKAYIHTGHRDFAGWTQAMASTVLLDKPYLSQAEIATQIQPMLDTLTTHDITQRVHEWLSANDRIVQYQTPHSTRINAITSAEVQAMIQQAQSIPSQPPTPKKVATLIDLPDIITTAHITNIEQHNNVYIYTLSTGDRVLWLSHPSAGSKTYIRATNGAGTQANELNAWQSQLATQLMFQHTPYHFNKEQITQFKKTHQLNLSAKQNSHEFVIDMNSEHANLDKLLNLYHAQMYHTAIQDGLDDIKATLMDELSGKNPHKTQQQLKNQALAQLKNVPLSLPTTDEINALTIEALHHEWQKITHTPTTFYVVSHAKPETAKGFIALFANPNHPLKPLTHTSAILANSQTITFPYHQEQRADVKLWTKTPHQWQGTDAMLVSLLKQIINEKLKLKLRDEKLGVYRLSFDGSLNAHTNQIDSELSFTTNPDRVDEMIDTAKEVLVNLPKLISQDDVIKAKANFLAQEKSRQIDPYTHLNRLALSDRQNNDLAYLEQITTLSDQITLANLKRMANKIYNQDSVQVWIDEPTP